MTGARAADLALKAANLALLALYPVAWTAPLATAALAPSWMPYFESDRISILNAVLSLADTDAWLSGLVALFGIAIPYAKTLALAAVQFRIFSPRALPLLEALGKLSMADVFLVAVTIVAVKGVGVGRVETAWGLYLFAGCVLLSMAVSWITAKRIAARRARVAGAAQEGAG